MNGYISGQTHKWCQVGLCSQAKEKHEYEQIYFGVDLCVHTPADELKGHCACYAEKEEANWTGIVMNRYIYVHVEQKKSGRACTQVVVVTGRSLDEREAWR